MYQKILEFYQAAYDILTRKGARLIMKMVLETDRLPNIIQDFIKYSDILRNLVEKATWEVVEDIKSMLYDHESKFPHTYEMRYLHSYPAQFPDG